MKRLIVSADDFGLTASVNEGIVKACREGIVTSVNLMPTGEAFAGAVKLAKEAGIQEAGAHLALTETSPLTGRDKIPTLTTRDGGFYKNYRSFFLRFFTGRIDLDQVYVELKSQMDALEKTGITITNLSSHEHIHLVPDILDIFIKLAKEYDVPAIRYPHKDSSPRSSLKNIYKSMILFFLGGHVGKALSASSIVSPEHFRGLFNSGKLDEETLIKIARQIEDGTTELVCHPGLMGPEITQKYTFHAACETELAGLTSPRVKKALDECGVKLIRYSDFLSHP